jgi:chromosome segregation ATPase
LTALNQQVQTLLENRIKLQQELGLALSSQSHLQGSVDNLEQQLANATSKLAVLQSERDCAVAIVSESNKQHQLEYKQLQESYNIAEEENREAGGTIQLLNEEKVEYMFKLDTLTSLVAAR